MEHKGGGERGLGSRSKLAEKGAEREVAQREKVIRRSHYGVKDKRNNKRKIWGG